MKIAAAKQARSFLDRINDRVQRLGLPDGLGSVIGWLMIGEPACQTPMEIAQAIDVPLGKLQPMLDMLVASQSVDRVTLPGRAETCYALRSPAELITRRSRQIGEMRGLLEEARAFSVESPEVQERLTGFIELYARFEAVLQDWQPHSKEP
jgi:hypothetical protein